MEPLPPAAGYPDRGLQPERTSLAWSRTLYVLVLDSVLFLRVGWLKHLPVITGAGVLLLCLAALMAGVTRHGVTPRHPNAFSLQRRQRLFRFMSFILLMVSAMVGVTIITTFLESRS